MSPRRAGALAVLLACSAAVPAAAQDLGARVRALGDGTAFFDYPVRAGVEVCDRGIRSGEGRTGTYGAGSGRGRCSVDEARVILRVDGGRVSDLDLRPAGADEAGARYLGWAEGPEAAGFLVGLARGGATLDAAEDALAAAGLARDADAWIGFLDIARDRSLDGDLRSAALFWVGQSAADRVSGELAGIAHDAGDEQSVKNAAVFALSRRPPDEAVPALIDLARTAGEVETRRIAMFWLARSDDPRVVPFFEAILTGGSPSD